MSFSINWILVESSFDFSTTSFIAESMYWLITIERFSSGASCIRAFALSRASRYIFTSACLEFFFVLAIILDLALSINFSIFSESFIASHNLPTSLLVAIIFAWVFFAMLIIFLAFLSTSKYSNSCVSVSINVSARPNFSRNIFAVSVLWLRIKFLTIKLIDSPESIVWANLLSYGYT